ncbi:hypothetical protein FQN57_000645 [Myotisia sp. PD_48]|nr:hypothetical protein FQN57_000645 [Myotisia sp. PD_48]
MGRTESTRVIPNDHLSYLPPLNLSHHFSEAVKRREGSSVKEFYKYFAIPGIHNLAGGLPHVSSFPFDTLSATAAPPTRFGTASSSSQPARSTRITIPKESNNPDVSKKIDLSTALQYGAVEGYPPLFGFIRQFVRENLHPDVPYAGGPEVIMTCGSTDGFSKTIEALTNIWGQGKNRIMEREGILCEEFAYMNAIQTVRPRGLNVVPVAMDVDGMEIDGIHGLAHILENWDYRRGKRPHLLYTVSIGQNPTGAVVPPERRIQIYALCQRYDIIIIEDEPYWNLQYRHTNYSVPASGNLRPTKHNNISGLNAPKKSSGFDFLDSLTSSYLSIDTDGRVVRLDTFSKTIAPGCRLGWLTAQPLIVERILRIAETSTQNPSGFVQVMVAGLIMGDQNSSSHPKAVNSAWKVDGWVRWLEGLRGNYEERMKSMCSVLEQGKYGIVHGDITPVKSNEHDVLDEWEVVDKIQMFDFTWPRAGMFVWLKICLQSHPLASQVEMEKLSQALWKYLTTKPYLCLVAPGQMFGPTQEIKQRGSMYMRLCFAPMSEEDVSVSSHNLVEGFGSFWQIKDKGRIADLLED